MTNKRNFIVAVALLVFTGTCYGQLIPYTGQPIRTIFQGAPVRVHQNGIPDPESYVSASAPGSNKIDLAVLNRITLGVDVQHKQYMPDPMKVRVRINVKRWDQQNTAMPDTSLHLEVFYQPFADSTYIRSASARFSGSYAVQATLDSIYVNGTYTDTLPANIVVSNEILINRRTIYAELQTPLLFQQIAAVNTDCDGSNIPDHIHLDWSNSLEGILEYQLEWLYINNYGADTLQQNTNLAPQELAYQFKYNSTRITTSNTSYDISLIFDKGWVVFRVRGIGVNADGKLVYGAWNLAESGFVSDASSNRFEVEKDMRHEHSLNWQYSATYAEEGKKKEIISYFDGSLRNRQTVTQINTDQNTIVGETIYDYQGRPAINVLPVPVTDPQCQTDNPNTSSVLKFYPNFNQNDASPSTGYSAADFDLSPEGEACAVSASPMGIQSGASQYYSPENLDRTAEQAYVPDAQKYPFTRVEYTPDNTGRIRRQSGVGPEFQLDSEHETRYLYGQPNQLELDRLFGSEVGDAKHYKKNVVIDAHGQASISYLDQEGRVIATALAGTAPENLKGIASEAADSISLSVNAFGQGDSQNNLSIEGNELVYSSQLTVASTSNYTFEYGLMISPLKDSCLPELCIDCVYDLTLELVDECGNDFFEDAFQQKVVGKFLFDDATGYTFHGVCSQPENGTDAVPSLFVANLTPGSYSLNKRLTINEDARQAYIDLYMNDSINSCIKTYEDFYAEAIALIDSSACQVTCEQCLETLGTLEEYVASGNGTANDYYLQKEDCERLCSDGASNNCEVAYNLMQMDMAPGGQYGVYQNSLGQTDLNTDILSIYRTPNSLPSAYGAPSWKLPKLMDAYGTHPIYVDMNGDTSRISLTSAGTNLWSPEVTDPMDVKYDPVNDEYYVYPEELASVLDFIDNFQFSWAKSLVVYHPEYCYYEQCIRYADKQTPDDAYSSDSFDALITSTNSFQAAVENGFLPQDYAVLFNSSGNATVTTTLDTEDWFSVATGTGPSANHAWDPFVTNYSFYAGSTNCTNVALQLQNKFLQYQMIGSSMRSMPEVAAYLARCGDNYYSNPQAACFNFGGPVDGQYDIDILNQEWNTLKSLYLSQKQLLQHDLADCIALNQCQVYCGCIGNEDDNPFASGMIQPLSASNPQSFLTSPYYDEDQPCSAALHQRYEQKDRRFPKAEDVVPIQNANDAAYEIYLSTGQCPVPFTLQQLLSALASDQKLDNSLVPLNDYAQLNALFQAENDFNMPGTLPNLVQVVAASGNTLTSNWVQNPGGTAYATLTLTKGSAAVSWDQLTSVINLYSGGGSSFTAEGVYGSNQLISLNGTLTTFDLQGCSFANECTLNELGSDLQELMSTLAATGNLTSMAGVNIDPLMVSGTAINGLQTLLIENAAQAGNDLTWRKTGPAEFRLSQAGATSQPGLFLQFNSAAPANFNWADLSQVNYFDHMQSAGQHLLEVTAHMNNGSSVSLSGTLIRKNADSTMTGVAVGTCELPVPVECQTDEHEAFDALYAVLKDVLVTQAFDGTQQVNLFESMYLESSITNQWDPTLNATTSTYSSSSDTLRIFAGECAITLTASGSNSLTQLIALHEMNVSGTTDNYFNYHDFQIAALFDNGSGSQVTGTIEGTTCLSLQQCYGCLPEVLSPVSLDTIRQQRLANGSYYLDKSVELYQAYAIAVDSFNLANNLSTIDTAFIEKKDYAYFSKNGFHFPMPGYLRYIAHARPGLDAMALLRDPDKFVAEYGYGTNVLFEYERYKKAVNRYNQRAQNAGMATMSHLSKQSFTDARIARSNGDYLTYIESKPQGGQEAQEILTYLGATTTATTPDEILYKQYTDAYLIFDNAQTAGTAISCTDYKRFSPMYSYQDIAENNLFCTQEGRQQFQGYINEISTSGCPGMLPSRKACQSLTEQLKIREEQKLFILYKESIKNFNHSLWSNSNTYKLPYAFSNVHQFILSGYTLECLKAYMEYLSSYTTSNNPNLPSLAPLSITDFAPCNGVLAADEPCKSAYSSYMECVNDYNSWALETGYTFFYKEIPSYETFVKYDVCGCVGEFCARLQEIKDGLIQFSNAKEYYAYLDYRSVCKQPCDPGQQEGVQALSTGIQLVDDCLEMQENQAIFNAQLGYQAYKDSLLSAIVQRYNAHCLSVEETLSYQYMDKQYHYTLYYYDQAGNLIKTVPPAGVELLPTFSSSDALSLQIAGDRANGIKTVYTSHRLATRYEYNSLNQLVAQSTPDTDPMNLFELTLPNGLHNRLITRKIQMVNENIGYLTGEVPASTAGQPTRGYLYKTTDGGLTWNRVYHLAGTDLKKAVMLTSTIGFAIGTNGIVLKTTDGGNTWDMLNSWATAGMITDLNDITYTDNGGGSYTVTVVGNNGLIAQSTNLQNFTALSVGSNWQLTAVSHSATQYVVTANPLSGSGATIFTKALTTGNWTPSNNFTAGTMHAVDVTSGNRAIIAGDDGRLFVNPDMTSTTSRWQLVETNLTGTISDLNFLNDQVGVALVNSKLHKTINGGTDWQQIDVHPYTHLSESRDGASILAVGPDSKMALIVNSVSATTPLIPVNSATGGMAITAGWVDHISAAFTSSTAAVIASGTKLYISHNAGELLPIWQSTDLSSVLSGATIKDIQLERISATGNALRGALLSSTGQLIRIVTNASGNVQSFTLIPAGGVLFKAISKDPLSANLYAYRVNGSVVRLNLNSTSNNLIAITSAATANQECMIAKGSSIILAGSEIRRVAAPGGTITVQTNATNPAQLLDVSYQNAYMTATGTDGSVYRLEGTAWKLISTGTNKDIYSSLYLNGTYYFAGEQGYFTKGTINAGLYTSSNVLLTTGSAVEENVSETLYDLTSNGDRMYAAGAQGRVLYSPNSATSAFAALNAGTGNLYGITPKVGSLKVLAVGQGEAIYEFAGALSILKTEVFTPRLTDVHFSSATVGTLLGDNFTVRKTINGGTSWLTMKPTTSVAPSAAYSEVITINENRSMLFGQGIPLNSNGLVLTNFPLPQNPLQVTDLARFQNKLYVLNSNTVIRLDLLDASNVNTVASFSGTANALDILPNGSFAVAGEDGLFTYFDPNGTAVITTSIGTEDINDLHFVDNTYAVAVGDQGAYYKFSATSMSPSGYPTAGNWSVQGNFFQNGTDPLGVNAYGQVDIYSIAFATPVYGILGGAYLDPSFATASHCYVRRIYDPNARYSSRFFYDRLGRLVVSQNARQYNSLYRTYSYTLYDGLGRVIEVGEKSEATATNGSGTEAFNAIFGTMVSGYYNPSVIDDNKLQAWITGPGNRREVTRSYYDKTILSGLPSSFTPDPLTQRKRITHVTYEEEFDGDDQTYDHATHYDYDIHGNVKTLLQDNRKMAENFPSVAAQRFKRMDYVYDLVSGNVHRMSVQNGGADQWHHAYRYDADNRIISAHTTRETPILDGTSLPQALENELVQNTDWEQDARYVYYDHGPLARVELGKDQLQGMDYIYNLQGWMKGVNATSLEKELDPGHDGLGSSVNETFAKDVMAFSLHYFEGDYNAIGAAGSSPVVAGLPAAAIVSSDVAANTMDLYNGNIKAMQTTLTHPVTQELMPMANAYRYDQLNRLLESRSFINLTGNQWGASGMYDNRYLNTFEYDAMGNIVHQNRYTAAGVQIENMSYGYKKDNNSNLLRNRLYQINDYVDAQTDLTDIDDMDGDLSQDLFNPQDANIETAYNYAYDEEGRLIRDVQEKIDQIVWRVDGKVKEIHRPSGSGKKNLSFDYDAMGNRIAKHVYDDDWNLEKSTYYILDAQGNQLNVYEHEVLNSTVTYSLKERHIYGSSMLGMYTDSVSMYAASDQQNTTFESGQKYYSMSNHLGNVLTVFADVKVPLSSDGIIVDSYRVGMRNISDYSPFGILLPERTTESAFYRKGFQGQEHDDEVKGEGNSVNFKYRMHDPRVGRFFAVDPLFKEYPFWTPYGYSGNMVIHMREIEGLEPIGSINPKTNKPYHNNAFSIGFPSGETVFVVQRGSYAITESGKACLERNGYTFTQSYPYESTSMSTDPTSQIRVSVGGTTVTSDHTSGEVKQINKFNQYIITPPENVVRELVPSPPIETSGKDRLYMTGSTITGNASTRSNTSDLLKSLEDNIRTQSTAIVNKATSGTTRTLISMTININASKYTVSEIDNIRNTINDGRFNFTINVNRTALPVDESYQGATVIFTDLTPQPATPVFGPTGSNVTITDLRKK